ncbi:MAG: hypothetical protein ACKO2N_22970 [Tabrizicola sp.]
MSLVASFPDGLAILGWRRLILTAAAFAITPALMGALLLLLAHLFGPGFLGVNPLQMEGFATFAAISPMITLPMWAVIAVGSAGLLKTGFLGSLPAAVLGCLAFGLLARTEIGLIAMPFGAVSALLYRMALSLQRPEAF